MKSYLAEMHNPFDMKFPLESALKALGLDLLAVLPTAFQMYDLRYLSPDNREGLHPGFYFILRYGPSKKLYGYIVTNAQELEKDFIELVVGELISKARKDKLRRLFLFP